MKNARTLALLALAGILAWACEPGPPPAEESTSTPTPAAVDFGRLVIVGGGLQSENVAVYQAVLDGREGSGPLCVLPTASGTPERSMEGYVTAFDSLEGPGTAKGILLTVDNAADASAESFRAEIEGCSGFFFTGGSQSRISQVFRPGGENTPVLDALWDRFREGAVIAGSSAGAAIMTDPMIAGGGSAEALRVGVRYDEEGEGVLFERGLGFLGAGLIDQHFLVRGRWGRLVVAILHPDTDGLGFGIDENTALVVEGDSARVVGESGVIFMDAREASREARGTGGYGIRLFLLGAGDVIRLAEGSVTWDRTKNDLPAPSHPFGIAEPDLFARSTLLEVLHELALAQDTRVTFSQAGHLVELRKGTGFRAMSREGEGLAGTPSGLSLGPFILSVWRE